MKLTKKHLEAFKAGEYYERGGILVRYSTTKDVGTTRQITFGTAGLMVEYTDRTQSDAKDAFWLVHPCAGSLADHVDTLNKLFEIMGHDVNTRENDAGNITIHANGKDAYICSPHSAIWITKIEYPGDSTPLFIAH